MADVRVNDMRNGYHEIVDYILTSGQHVPSRNGATIEVESFTFELTNPRDSLPLGIGRNVNRAIGAVEAIALVSGIADAELITAIQPNFKNYMDDGEFWGAYGPRTKDQLPEIARKLKEDPDTRQAIITIWQPERDNVPGKRDYPCTVTQQFMIRNGQLNLKTFMRSNDVWWGLGYDAFQFTQLQLTMANVIDVPVGTYTHHASSMHIYEPHWEEAEKLEWADAAREEYADGFYGETWEEARNSAQTVLYAAKAILNSSENPNPKRVGDALDLLKNERWYLEALVEGARGR